MSGAESISAPTLSLDDQYRLLAAGQRREVLRSLQTLGEAADRSDVIDHVAAAEATRDDDNEASHRKRVYIGLHQTHFPALDDAGVIEYREEPDQWTVVRGPNFSTLVNRMSKGDSA